MRVDNDQPPSVGGPEAGGTPLTKALGKFVFQQLNTEGKPGLSEEEAAKSPAYAEMFEDLNKNGDVVIDAEEMAAAGGGGGGPGQGPGAGRSPLDQAITEFVFKLLNKDGDKVLSPEDAAEIPDLAAAFEELDTDGVEGISVEELAAGQKPQKPTAT